MQPPPPGRQTKAERKGLGELGVGLAGQRGVEAEVYALLGAKHKATDPGGEPGAPDVDAAAWGQELPPRNRRKEGVKLNSGGPGQGRGGAHRGAPATAPVPAPSLHGAPSRPEAPWGHRKPAGWVLRQRRPAELECWPLTARAGAEVACLSRSAWVLGA